MKNLVPFRAFSLRGTAFFALLLCASVLPAGMITIKAQANPLMFIRSGTTADPTTMKTITWMTNPSSNPQAKMKIAKKSDGVGSFVEISGKTKNFTYNTNAYTVGTNGGPDIPKTAYSVTIDHLEPGITYIYQVGDGTNWSKTLEFTTTTVINKYTYYIFGDLQASNDNITTDVVGGTAWLRRIAKTCENSATRPLFSIQVGDLVDREHVYNYYRLFGDICNDYPEFANTDMINTMGNHEYYRGLNGLANLSAVTDPPRGDISKFLYGIPPTNNSNAVGSGTYSVDYANMHIITLDFIGRGTSGSSTAQIINAQAEWLRADLAKCNKRWKVVNVHYPIFYDGTDWSQTYPSVETAFGSIFDEFGVNAVFQGHVHTTRRIQVKNGAVTGRGCTFQGGVNQINTATNGTTYITCGNLSDNTDATVYIKGEVDGSKMTLTMIQHNGPVRDNLTIMQTVPVTSVSVTGAGGETSITTDGGALQMQEIVLPDDANNRTVKWTITQGADIAGISATGLLTAKGNGAVTVCATANDGSRKYGEANITISGQRIPVTSIMVNGEGYVTSITEKDGSLQMRAIVLPNNATDKTVTWSLKPTTVAATISEDGLLTAVANEQVIVRAMANDGSGKNGEAIITISGQSDEEEEITGIEIPFIPNLKMFPNPFFDKISITGAENCTLRIMDATGTIVHIQNITNAIEVISLEQLQAGVYFFSVEKDGQTKMIKIVKE